VVNSRVLRNTVTEPVQQSSGNGANPDLSGTVDNLKAYPNPITDEVTVTANLGSVQDVLTLRLLDVSGKTLMVRQFSKVPAGVWMQRVQVGRYTEKPGIYILQVIGSDRRPVTYKLIRSR
jgi:hypothetical protein